MQDNSEKVLDKFGVREIDDKFRGGGGRNGEI